MATSSWTAGKNGPKDVAELRKHMLAQVKSAATSQLIDAKFTRDHIYAGHKGGTEKLATMLANQRELTKSTLLISSMSAQAREEVVNWIAKIPSTMLTLNHGVWSINTTNSAVPALNVYKWATVDFATLKSMNSDDVIKKSRKWLTESEKKPEIACQFGANGCPVIYHLNY
ncbi:hypothetical protein HF313_21720 [Massilia atriviolacea]|uniref:Uncharacterized protein n=1 Tax=Massilia atriviolacea TaxID=2495579 RepID=A0A430HF54_9BURK|nr:hypothetical protein [Massilia atriviolacea]RSZ56194.1 hypothetical protein EJB06_25155 [Massilia atriviolacea]